MGPTQIELIVALVKHGSLNAAAKHLGRSQPAVTKALKKIEISIGAPLFFRTSQGVAPTEVGQAAYERCLKISNDLRRLDEDMRQIAGDFVGEVSVVVSPLAALLIIPNVAARFRNRFPNVRLTIIGGHPPDAFRLLRSGSADFVIGPAPEAGHIAGLVVQKLFQSQIVFVTGAKSRHLENPTPQSLANAQWVKIGLANRRPTYADFFKAHNLPEPVPVATSDSVLSVLSMVRNSELLASLPKALFDETAQQWNLHAVKVSEATPYINVTLSSSKDQIQTRAAEVFADLVKDCSANLSDEI